jgi:hypothetical protein
LTTGTNFVQSPIETATGNRHPILNTARTPGRQALNKGDVRPLHEQIPEQQSTGRRDDY